MSGHKFIKSLFQKWTATHFNWWTQTHQLYFTISIDLQFLSRRSNILHTWHWNRHSQFNFTALKRCRGKVIFSQESVCPQGVCFPTMPWGRQTPSPRRQTPSPDTINRWAVRILPECIILCCSINGHKVISFLHKFEYDQSWNSIHQKRNNLGGSWYYSLMITRQIPSKISMKLILIDHLLLIKWQLLRVPVRIPQKPYRLHLRYCLDYNYTVRILFVGSTDDKA